LRSGVEPGGAAAVAQDMARVEAAQAVIGIPKERSQMSVDPAA